MNNGDRILYREIMTTTMFPITSQRLLCASVGRQVLHWYCRRFDCRKRPHGLRNHVAIVGIVYVRPRLFVLLFVDPFYVQIWNGIGIKVSHDLDYDHKTQCSNEKKESKQIPSSHNLQFQKQTKTRERKIYPKCFLLLFLKKIVIVSIPRALRRFMFSVCVRFFMLWWSSLVFGILFQFGMLTPTNGMAFIFDDINIGKF